MGQDFSSAAWARLRPPAVCLQRALSHSRNAAIANARYHPYSSGKRLCDDYEVESTSVLGRGSGGDAVLLAYDCKARLTKFAVKTLDQRRAPRDILWQRAAEVEILLAIDHPHVVRLHDVYETDYGLVHLVMECCTGGELFFRLMQKGSFGEQDASKIMVQMLRAVGYLHAHGIVHRDLKLENFLFGSADEGAPLKLIDFGFGALWDRATPMQTCCGSLNYVSPEVLLQQGYTEKCDMWSLGVVAFMLLTGQPPFQGPEREVKRKIKFGKVEWNQGPKPSKWDTLSSEAWDFVTCLLVKDPKERISAKRAIYHPWLIREAAVDCRAPLLGAKLMQSLCRYAATPPLQRAVLQLIVQHLTPAETDSLSRTFLSLDMDNEGALRLEDLKAAIQRSCQQLEDAPEASSTNAVDLCAELDAIWGPWVSYTDFLAASVELQGLLQPKMVAAAFRRLDADSSGQVSLEDVQKAFGKAFDTAAVAGWMRQTSPDSNEVSLHAFRSSLRRSDANNHQAS